MTTETTATETTPTEDERMMALVKACQHAMIEGDDADSVEGLPSPDSDEDGRAGDLWEDALGHGESRIVVLCWQDPHGRHFSSRSEAQRNDAEWVDTENQFVEGFARPVYANIEHLEFVPENASQSHVAIVGIWIGDWEGDEIEISREPPCTDDDGHSWVSHGTAYGTPGGCSGGSVCEKCGLVDSWRYLHGGRVEHSYYHPQSEDDED